MKGEEEMRKRDDNIFDLLALFPWWVSVIVAGVFYVGLRFVIPQITFTNQVAKSFALVLPNLAPLFWIFLIPGGISLYHSFRKRKQFDKQSGLESIRALSWKEFEELLGEAYRRRGYLVRENSGTGPDGGVDLAIERNGSRTLVQCKQWRERKVGVQIVREMFGIMTAEKADGVIIVSSGMFTQEAENFAEGKAIDLVDGGQLLELVKNVQTAKAGNRGAERQSAERRQCPRCGNELVIRVAKRGQNIGKKFWGCSSYPECGHTEGIREP